MQDRIQDPLPIVSHQLEHGIRHFKPKAVLFDMDGVIYDSMPNHAVSWHQSMADFGLLMTEEDAYRYEGMRGVETIKTLVRAQWHRELDDEEALSMYKHKSDLYNACQPANIMPGILRLMRHLKSDGLKICVVTGSGQRTLLDKLLTDFEGLLSEELIVTAFDVEHGKPHPEPYQKGMEKCGVTPEETIVIENAPLGIEAAVAAHCFTIAVNTGPLPDKVLTDAGADMVFPSMKILSRTWRKLYADLTTVSHEERWMVHYQTVKTYIETYKRCPSKHRIEDHRMLNWIKFNKKLIVAGKLRADRLALFNELMELAQAHHHINQHV